MANVLPVAFKQELLPSDRKFQRQLSKPYLRQRANVRGYLQADRKSGIAQANFNFVVPEQQPEPTSWDRHAQEMKRHDETLIHMVEQLGRRERKYDNGD